MSPWIDSVDLRKGLGQKSCEQCGPVEGLYCLTCNEFTEEGHREECRIHKQYLQHEGHTFQRKGDKPPPFYRAQRRKN